MAEEMNQNVQPQGWRDVQINPEMSIAMLVGFMNVLNQRLATVEDLVNVADSEGNAMNLTEYYARQAQAEMAAAQAKAEEEASKGE